MGTDCPALLLGEALRRVPLGDGLATQNAEIAKGKRGNFPQISQIPADLEKD
jgi:hypothetical protein